MLCFETILIDKGTIPRLKHHNHRLNDTRQKLFRAHDYLDLQSYITHRPQTPTKCRVLYNTQIHSITYTPYQNRYLTQESFVLQAFTSTLEYTFKYNSRSCLQKLYAKRGKANEVLIIKNGFITDTSTSNVAFLIGGVWLTPKIPLLKGTMRDFCLQNQIIQPDFITLQDAKSASKLALLNALVGFFEIANFTIKE